MTLNLRNISLAVALMVSSAPFMSLQAEAKSSFMEQCSALYKAGKADGSVADTVKWTDFMKTNCASLKADAPAVEEPAVKPKKEKKAKKAEAAVDTPAAVETAAKPEKVKKAKKAVVVAPAEADSAATGGSFMQNCSAAWKAMKAADTVPAGMAWKDFVAAKCVVAAAAPAPAAKPAKKKKVEAAVMQDETPDEATAVAVDNGPVKTMDKNGKPFTAGQLAAHARARACGLEWRTAKAAGEIRVGQKWPQYWSECNTRMKAAGQ
jgi:hypothetical protein